MPNFFIPAASSAKTAEEVYAGFVMLPAIPWRILQLECSGFLSPIVTEIQSRCAALQRWGRK
jgi:hypothetical protein